MASAIGEICRRAGISGVTGAGVSGVAGVDNDGNMGDEDVNDKDGNDDVVIEKNINGDVELLVMDNDKDSVEGVDGGDETRRSSKSGLRDSKVNDFPGFKVCSPNGFVVDEKEE